MFGLRRLLALAAFFAFFLGACSGGNAGIAPGPVLTPTSVPPAVAFADDAENASGAVGLWDQVEANSGLASCIADAINGDATSIEELRVHVDALGDDANAVVADCLTGA